MRIHTYIHTYIHSEELSLVRSLSQGDIEEHSDGKCTRKCATNGRLCWVKVKHFHLVFVHRVECGHTQIHARLLMFVDNCAHCTKPTALEW